MPNFPEFEKQIIEFWKEKNIFQKSIDERPKDKLWSFYDGPPFATGLPHYGHLLAGTIKDVLPRFFTMQGYRVNRRAGWDCHGLPVEYEVEKETGIKDKKEIQEKIGVEKFNSLCRQIVLRYTKEWEKTIERMGRWVDFKNAYRTMDKEYMESIWWVFKQLWDKGLVYQDYRSSSYCPRCATPLSNFEVNLGYKDKVPDPSVYIKFKIKDTARFGDNAYFLVWTTTPWTLPGNVALAIKKDADYAFIAT
ncbi:MAG: class I tRNA ligase family protein, partial [Parcubacteria group bacterium]|nr:class I tRNA ligase family protein [Parcubacteria group bacterium]